MTFYAVVNVVTSEVVKIFTMDTAAQDYAEHDPYSLTVMEVDLDA